MFERLDHVALLTPDVTRASDFYCEWAGMHVIHSRNDEGFAVAWVQLASDPAGLIIVLLQSSRERAEGRLAHFGFHVRSRQDVDDIAHRAATVGILKEGPEYAGPVIGYYCIILDPDGNQLEFSCEQLTV